MSNSMIEKVKAVIAAPSCCAELRAVAEEWLQAVGTDGEKEASAKLIAELEEDVSTLDDVIPFFESETGAQFFGADVAKAKAEEAKKSKGRRRHILPLPRLPGRCFHSGGKRLFALIRIDVKRSGRLTGPFSCFDILCQFPDLGFVALWISDIGIGMRHAGDSESCSKSLPCFPVGLIHGNRNDFIIHAVNEQSRDLPVRVSFQGGDILVVHAGQQHKPHVHQFHSRIPQSRRDSSVPVIHQVLKCIVCAVCDHGFYRIRQHAVAAHH